MIWIILVHFIETFVDGAYFGNPNQHWPTLTERWDQLRALPITGIDGAIVNALRWICLPGDQGVQIFIAASGFGLTIAMLGKNSAAWNSLTYIRQRFLRIAPLWVGAHLAFLLGTGWHYAGLDPWSWRTWASLIGLRSLPSTMYYFVGAWWFVGLLIQLYAVFPLLLRQLVRIGPKGFFALVVIGSVVVRGIGLHLITNIDWWSRGGIFVSRLPEFAFGMLLAAWLSGNGRQVWLSRKAVVCTAGLLAILIGNAASFTLLGMSVAFLLTGAGWLLVFFAWRAEGSRPLDRLLAWVSAHSLSIFLVHHPIIKFLVPTDLAQRSAWLVLGSLFMVLALSVLLALALESIVSHGQNALAQLAFAVGPRRCKIALGMTAVLFIAANFVGEAALRRYNPQEVLGWGERASLQPDERYGYKLIPNRTTRLRWLSYDYHVISSALGFPAPDYPHPKCEGVLRILVTGDAYESAEGVDTYKSWPRQLEASLRTKGQQAEILNLSVTGWGPNQYLAAVEEHAERFAPDFVIVGLFVNDFIDVRLTHQNFQENIGFGKTDPNSLLGWLGLHHLRSYLRDELTAKLLDRIGLRPYDRGLFFGYYDAIDRQQLSKFEAGAPDVADRLRKIQAISSSVGARLIVLQVPAPVQVCPQDAVDYTPSRANLSNTQQFDQEQLPTLVRRTCAAAGVQCVDLRPAFDATVRRAACQSNNLHWTIEGHAAVARWLQQLLPPDDRATANFRQSRPVVSDEFGQNKSETAAPIDFLR